MAHIAGTIVHHLSVVSHHKNESGKILETFYSAVKSL